MIEIKQKDEILSRYLWAMDHGDGLAYLLDNASLIKSAVGPQLLKEMILNYRTHNPKNPKLILDKFYNLVYNKQEKHISDLAIAYNIVTNFRLDDANLDKIVKFMYGRVKSDTPLLKSLADITNMNVVRSFTVKHVEQLLENRKGYNHVS